jgi:hypothetical protein
MIIPLKHYLIVSTSDRQKSDQKELATDNEEV